MSAISGIVNLAGGPVRIAALDRMSQAGFARGPDVHSRWTSESAVLDYRGVSPIWSAGPEDHLLNDGESGVTVLLCGRIDGRTALRQAFSAAPVNRPFPDSDCGLILRAYLSFGLSFAEQLIGEFAFALWDSYRRTLILGRDPGGVGQLFYTVRPDGSIRFATGLNQLLSAPDVDRKPDIEGMLDFYLTRGTVDPERALIVGVKRVPPASIVLMSDGAISVRTCWDLDRAIAQTEWIPPAELPDACAAALQDAIRDRVRGQRQVGLQLSGGWDSGAIFQIWQSMCSGGEPLAEPRTYSYYYSGYPEMDERREIAGLLRRWPAKSCFARYDCAAALPDLKEHCGELGSPEMVYMWRQTRNLAARARAEGVRVWMNGEGGNHIFECSRLRTADFLIRGRWRAAAEQNRIFARECGRSPSRGFWLKDARQVSRVLFPRTIAATAHIRDRFSAKKQFEVFAPRCRSILARLARTHARNNGARGSVRGGFEAWREHVGFQNLTREYFNLGSAPAVEGIVVSSPFLDPRVAPLALRGLTREFQPSGSRSLLAAAIRTCVEKPACGGKHAFADRTLAATIRRDLSSVRPGSEVSTLVSHAIINPDVYSAVVSELRSGANADSAGMWRLLALDSWAAALLP